MSASREKKKRQNTDNVAPVVSETVSKKPMNKTVKKSLIIAVSVILVVAVAFLMLVSSGFFAMYGTAAVVNGHKLSPAMVNYFYRTTVNNMSETLSYVLDTSVPLDEQPYFNTDMTWADYLLNESLSGASEIYAMYDAAVADGMALTEEDIASIDNNLYYYGLYASMYGLSDTNAMLANEFGQGCNEKNFREYMTITLLASRYASEYNNSLTYDDAAISAFYSDNHEDFDGVTFRLFALNVSDDSENVEAELADLEKVAKEMAESSAGDEFAFTAKAYELAPEDEKVAHSEGDSTLREDITFSSVEEVIADWVLDGSRAEGETTYIQNGEEGYYVVYFKEFTDRTYELPNVRHILISATNTSDEAAMTDAKIKAEALLADFEAGEKTEEAFAALADENSSDSAEGGLYENVYPGQMVTSFEDWCFDESRQIGDTGIIESEYGYHIMYFSGYGMTYRDYMVSTTMRENDYAAWREGIISDVGFTTKPFFLKFVAL